MIRPFTPLGTKVKPYGAVGAVGLAMGERYYWLVDKHGTVSMMPADVIEALGEAAVSVEPFPAAEPGAPK